MSLFSSQPLLEYKAALNKRRAAVTKDLDVTRHSTNTVNSAEMAKANLGTFNLKNKHLQRMSERLAKHSARTNIKPDGVEAGGQAIPTKDHIRHVDIGKGYDNNKIYDHEIGHTHQMAAAYKKGGTRGLFKALTTEGKRNMDKPTTNIMNSAKLSPSEQLKYGSSGRLKDDVSRSGYYKSGLEHNANNFALHGDTKAVRKEREAAVQSRLKGVSAAKKFDSKYRGTKNFDDQMKLMHTSRPKHVSEHDVPASIRNRLK